MRLFKALVLPVARSVNGLPDFLLHRGRCKPVHLSIYQTSLFLILECVEGVLKLKLPSLPSYPPLPILCFPTDCRLLPTL